MNSMEIIFILRTMAIVIMGIGVFPPLWRETVIRDDLTRLRWLIFAAIAIYCIGTVFLLYVSFLLFTHLDGQSMQSMSNIVNATSFMLISIILTLIYRKKYL